jgi:hypothetical protein
MVKKGFCDSCDFEGELVERADGKWFHNNPGCYYDGYRKKVKEGFCFYCGLKEEDGRTPFVKRRDGKVFHGDCANRSEYYD